MGDRWHNPETSKAREPRSTGPLAEAFGALIKSVVVGGVLAIPACAMIPQYAPIGEQIGLWSVYAIAALAYLHWKKAKEILPNGNPNRPFKIVWVVLMICFWRYSARFCSCSRRRFCSIWLFGMAPIRNALLPCVFSSPNSYFTGFGYVRSEKSLRA
jgi:hypothetical protein